MSTRQKYLFTFMQQVLRREGCSYLRLYIPAETHSEAFAAWCASPLLQDLSMAQLGWMRLEIKELS